MAGSPVGGGKAACARSDSDGFGHGFQDRRPVAAITNWQPTLAAGFALWALGFRPFYLLASIFAALSIPLWVAVYAGYLPAPFVPGLIWHGHEMLFGYTLAVVAGFLFTAGRNWTGQPTPTGVALQAFALLWVAGRVLILTPYAMAAALVNAAFPVAVAIALSIPLWRSRNPRNYFFVAHCASRKTIPPRGTDSDSLQPLHNRQRS